MTELLAPRRMVELEVDGQAVSVFEGSTILDACTRLGIDTPTLCYGETLRPANVCRVCVVEIEGARVLAPACSRKVEPGMKVKTQTSKLADLRRGVMELYISDHPLDCLTCAANGDCELQDMAGAVGLREVRYGYEGANHLGQPKDETNPYFTFDPSKCIVCSRCVRACEEIQGTYALTIDSRGFPSGVCSKRGTSSGSPSSQPAKPGEASKLLRRIASSVRCLAG